jgi:hypothetical protein
LLPRLSGWLSLPRRRCGPSRRRVGGRRCRRRVL